MSKKQGTSSASGSGSRGGHKSRNEMSKRPLLNYLRMAGAEIVNGVGGRAEVKSEMRIDFKPIIAHRQQHNAQSRSPPPPQPIQQPVQHLHQPHQQQKPLAQPIQQPSQLVQPLLTPLQQLNITNDPSMKLSEFLKVKSAMEDQNRLLSIGNVVDGLSFGICTAVIICLFYTLISAIFSPSPSSSISRRRRYGLLFYILTIFGLAGGYLIPSILSRIDHTRLFLKMTSKQAEGFGDGKVFDIDFTWWEGAVESEIPMRANLMLVDVLMGYLVLLTWRDDSIVLMVSGGLLALRLVADIMGFPFILPLLFEVKATILIIARAIIDKKSIDSPEDTVNYPSDNTKVRSHIRHLSSGGSGYGSIPRSPTTSTSSGFRHGDGKDGYGESGWHLTPPIYYILATGLYTNLRILEFVAAIYGVAWEDLWLNTAVFCGAFMAQSILILHFIHNGPMPVDELFAGLKFSSASGSRVRIRFTGEGTTSSTASEVSSAKPSPNTLGAGLSPTRVPGGKTPSPGAGMLSTPKAKSDPGGL